MAADPSLLRTRSARRTLISLLLIPLLSLTVLWGFTASITLGNVIRYQHYNTVITAIGPSVTALEQTLPVERAITLVWLGGGRQSALMRTAMTGSRRSTDKYVPAVRSAVMSVRGLLGAKAIAQMNVFLEDLAGLGRIRAAVDSGAYDTVATFNAYSAIGNAEYEFFHVSSPPADPGLSLMTQSAIAEARAQDFTGGAIALIEGALTAGGLMSQPERVLFAQMVGQQNLEIADTFSLADPVLTANFKRVYDLPAYQRLQAIENKIETSPADQPIPVNPVAFQTTAKTIQAAVVANGSQIGVVLAAKSAQLRDSTVTALVLAAGLGLVGVAASIFVMVRFGRRLRVELSNLYESARQMAHERLPRLVERLRRGEDVDVQAESPPPQAARITEIADVAQAFSTVQRTAAEAAVGQASLRKGVNQVFVNLSLRTQSLLHRQLGMLDTMERATSDPAVLADLFRLDHLTTRMRRHAEGLLIMAGSTPGRGWRDPVPVADVLQAAIAEIEDYVRVDVITDSADAVAGIAVNDVIHLIAELVENATVFSPPNTRVVITGSVVARGFAVEIEDRGLGMAPDAIAAVNERLASPPEFDPANSERLGLFVAGQLAARHAIKVSLRSSPFGGMAAIVLLPWQIIVPEHEADAWFGSGGRRELTAAAHGRAHDAGPAGSLEGGLAFGMTGRHRLAQPGSSPEGGRADRTRLDEPRPAQAQPGSPMAAAAAAAWAVGSGAVGSGAIGSGAIGSGAIGSGAIGSGAIGSGEPGGAAGDTYLGLPRRVRQANLAPQLHGELGGQLGAEASGPAARSPEQTSGLMSALQDGWLRGRVDDLDENGGGS